MRWDGPSLGSLAVLLMECDFAGLPERVYSDRDIEAARDRIGAGENAGLASCVRENYFCGRSGLVVEHAGRAAFRHLKNRDSVDDWLASPVSNSNRDVGRGRRGQEVNNSFALNHSDVNTS